MKKILLSFACVTALALGSCGTTGTSTTTTVNNIVTQVQSIAVQVCGFLPTASTIINIVSAGNPIATTAEVVANSICAAVRAVPKLGGRFRGRFGGAAPITVNGVVVHGRFVR